MKVILKQIDNYLKSTLKDKRYRHTLSVVESAVQLAEIYNCDVKSTTLAALLHDCAKDFSDDKMRQILLLHNIKNDVFYNCPQLAHGQVGAIVAKHKFKIEDEDILNAIRYHSFGRPQMSQLEKIIYIADAIERQRSYKGVEKARKLATKSLDKTMFYLVENSLTYLLKNEKYIYPQTLMLWNEYIINKGV